MEYPNVKNAHVVPRTYLENFADENSRIAAVLVEDGRVVVRRVTKVGTRRRFYRRERPDGTQIDDIEKSLGDGEAAATPVLRSFADGWPLNTEEKVKLAELFAYQLLRGPRWKAEHAAFVSDVLAGWRREGKVKARGEQQEVTDAEIDEAVSVFGTDTSRYISMLRLAPTLATVLGSMHWTLVDLRTPLIATSDHPVVLWPLSERSRRPQPTPVGIGVLACFEIRLPLSPRHLVLMTWLDAPDAEVARVSGARHHASNANAFTRAQGDQQWFHLPGTSPPIGSGRLLPLALELLDSYTFEAARTSRRRERTSSEVRAKTGRSLADREITIVRMDRTARPTKTGRDRTPPAGSESG